MPTDEFTDIRDYTGWRSLPIGELGVLRLPDSIVDYGPERLSALLFDFADPHGLILGLPDNELQKRYGSWMLGVSVYPMALDPSTFREKVKDAEARLFEAHRAAARNWDPDRPDAFTIEPLLKKEVGLLIRSATGVPIYANWSVVVVRHVSGQRQACHNLVHVRWTTEGLVVLRFLGHPMTMPDAESIAAKVRLGLIIHPEKALSARRASDVKRAKEVDSAAIGIVEALQRVPLVWGRY